ncbi:unnamed protein product [Sphagnum balticum]
MTKKGFTHEKTHRGLTDTWLTPLELVRALGEFDLDPCAYPGHLTAKNLNCFPSDGLSMRWSGRVFLNPPYGPQTGAWLEKLAEHGYGTALVFARTDTRWFHTAAKQCSGFLFLKGRIKFLRPDGTVGDQAAAPSLLMSFGLHDALRLKAAALQGVFLNLA